MSGQPESDDSAANTAESTDGAEDQQGAEAAADEATGEVDLAAALADAEAKADENWNRYLRTAAELENVRKRAERDVENAHKFAVERFAKELLQVCDSLEMGIAAGGEAGADALLEGSNATLKQLESTLQRFGVERVDPLGEPFDPALHEAMTMQPSPDAEPGSVLTVFQKGYTLNGRLLRPARVVVAAEPPVSADKASSEEPGA
jgi:molecular chaperone GrpE